MKKKPISFKLKWKVSNVFLMDSFFMLYHKSETQIIIILNSLKRCSIYLKCKVTVLITQEHFKMVWSKVFVLRLKNIYLKEDSVHSNYWKSIDIFFRWRSFHYENPLKKCVRFFLQSPDVCSIKSSSYCDFKDLT